MAGRRVLLILSLVPALRTTAGAQSLPLIENQLTAGLTCPIQSSRTRGLLKNSNPATVAALYERRFFLESTKYRRS